MYRDVTALLAVDASDPDPSSVDDAVESIRNDHRTVVADDATAASVLERLGLARARAVDQMRVSYGPMRNPTDECL